ncbi:MAG TPA: phage portal protein [Mycobacterium sp.]|nr:phage portal protein [Mycobacterium sp.]
MTVPVIGVDSAFFRTVVQVPPDAEPTPDNLTEEEEALLGALKRQLTWAKRVNLVKNEYYEMRQRIKDLEIAIPPQLPDIEVCCGWPETIVDVLEERIDLMGFTSTGDLMGLDKWFEDNALDVEASRATSDALITGTSFISVGKGDTDAGEPEILIMAESPSSATVIWDYRKRRAAAGLSQTYDKANKVVLQSLYLPDKTVKWALDPANPRRSNLEIVGTDRHNLGRPLMTRLINRDRASDIKGRSEITRAIRYYTDAAIRTMLGMEVNREFYTTPMRTALDVYPESVGLDENLSKEEKARRGWSLLMGHMNVIPPQTDNLGPGQTVRPQVVQFSPAPPTPYIEQVKAYSIQVAAASGIPASMLGFITDNPTSADAIIKGEYRLIRRAERRVQSYRQGWKEAAVLALLVNKGTGLSLDDVRAIQPEFRNPATPTRAAAADETQKLVAAEVLPPRSRVTWTRLGISPRDQDQLELDWRKRQAEQTAEQMKQHDMQMQQTEAQAKIRAQAGASGPGAQTGQPGTGAVRKAASGNPPANNRRPARD